MGQFSTNSYVNERKQPKNGLNNCPTNNGANDTENNEKTSTRQIIEHPHSPFPANRFYPQRQIEYTTSATAIAIPAVVNASGQVIDSPSAQYF
ncbi:hypothetical protein KXR27_004897 [Escherichia coli]|nr:hypothetical protein [Escherichia coli]